MWYLNMNAVMALTGMVLVLVLTRRWPSNKRYLLLAFNLCFLLLFSEKLFFFYLAYTSLNYMAFLFLCQTRHFRKLVYYADRCQCGGGVHTAAVRHGGVHEPAF